MAKFKVDLTGVKQYLFEKGERVGLIGCTVIMVLVVGYALYSGFTAGGAPSGKSWDEELAGGTKKVHEGVTRATLQDPPPPLKLEDCNWPGVRSNYSFTSMFPLPDPAFTKKLNPQVLSLYNAEVEKSFQVDYVRGGYYAYEIDPATQKVTIIVAGGGGGSNKAIMGNNTAASTSNLAKIVQPARMVVVSGVFPMWDQLEEFRKALRYGSKEELLVHRDELPKPVGIDVMRCEILRDGTPKLNKEGKVDWRPLFVFDKNLKANVASPVMKSMLREMLIDNENPRTVASHVFPGLVTPLPLMANALYTKLDLRGLEVKEVVAGGEDVTKPGGNSLGPPAAGKGSSLGPPAAGKGSSLGPPAAGKSGPAPAMPGKGVRNPGMEEKGGGAAAGENIQLKKELWKRLPKDLLEKFTEKYFVFHPLGLSEKSALAAVSQGAKSEGSRVGMMQGKEGGDAPLAIFGWDAILGGASGQSGAAAVAPNDNDPDVKAAPAAQFKIAETDALVRFFDPEVQPGKTYRWSIRVRMENPNYGKKNEVAYQALADQKELEPFDVKNGGWTITPEITIPGDYNWYVVDQQPEIRIRDGADYTPPIYRTDMWAPIQVHRWLDRVPDAEAFPHLVADWAIAERLYVRRGESVGREKVMIEMPEWRPALQTFEIGVSVQQTKSKTKLPTPKDAPQITGLPVNLLTNPPAIVVDFDGGKRASFPIEKRDGTKDFVSDASAVDILVLTPDGKLVVRNSRHDTDPETHAGAQREERFRLVRERLTELRHSGGGGGGIEMPSGLGPAPKN